jgi:hypothetical protein
MDTLMRQGPHAARGDFIFLKCLEAVPKNGIWFKVEEEAKRQPEEYWTYFEDWLFASDEEIGPYNFFGMASNVFKNRLGSTTCFPL